MLTDLVLLSRRKNKVGYLRRQRQRYLSLKGLVRDIVIPGAALIGAFVALLWLERPRR